MEFRVFAEPQQGASYEDQLAVAQAAEKLGFNAFFRSDHYMNGAEASALPGPTDSWTTLGALARETSTIRLGTLVTSVTFRHPGVLAVQVAQVDQMSGGRVELGIGAGWNETEHRAYGIPFPKKRFGLYEEQLEVITGLWSTPEGALFSHSGTHYTLENSPALPKPIQRSIPVIIGGAGRNRTPAIAARFASEYNTGVPEIAAIPGLIGRVRAACEAIERDPDSLVYSSVWAVAAGATDAEAARRASAGGFEYSQLRVQGLAGTPAEIVDKLGAARQHGITRVYLQIWDLHDLDHLDFLAREIVPQLS
jgi:F420-dependent oxidoreductase-like protein